MQLLSSAAIGLGAVSIVGAVVAQAGRFYSPPDILAHFAPVYLVGSGVALVGSMLTRRRSSRVLLLLLGIGGILASGALIVPGLVGVQMQKESEASRTIKIVQFNLNGDRLWDDRIVRWIISEDPDVVVLQDLDPVLHALISRRISDRHIFCSKDCKVALISKGMPNESDSFGGGAYGLTPATIVVDFGAGSGHFTMAGTHIARPGSRGASSPTASVWVQEENMRRLRRILKDYDQNTLILVGDFNSTPWSFARRRDEAGVNLMRRTDLVFTWPANPTGVAFLAIDHVYAGRAWKTVSIRRGPRLGSDHYPVVAVLAPVPLGT